MPKPEKIQAVDTLKSKFSAAKGIVLADFTGLTVAEVNELRRKCREAQVEYRVVKNTLARIAAKEAQITELVEHFQGPVAVALSEVDSIAPARVLDSFRKETQKPTLKAGFVEGKLFTAEELQKIASLPSRDGLVAQVIGAIQGPMAQVVWTLEGVLRNLVSILDQAAQKQGAS